MKVWVSCEMRGAEGTGHKDYRGYALLVDWEKKEVLTRWDAPVIMHPEMDEKYSGRYARGLRAMVHHNGEIYALMSSGAIVLDAETLEEKRRISNREWLGGHYFVWDRDGFWMNNNQFDEIVKVGIDGKIKDRIELRRFSFFQNECGLKPERPPIRDVRYQTEDDIAEWKEKKHWVDQLHINSIQVDGDRIYVGSCTKQLMVQVRPSFKVIHRGTHLGQPHDFTLVGDRVLVNCSARQRFAVFAPSYKTMTHVPEVEGLIMSPRTCSYFTRGLYVLDNDRVLVGYSPLSVVEMDIVTGDILGQMVFSHETAHTCHGITAYEEAA